MRQVVERFPVPTSQRTISVAKHSFPVYLAYDGRGIGIIRGIAPIEPDETGIVPSYGLKATARRRKWQNPLRLALRYQALLENGKSKADIAGMMGSSRARVIPFLS